MTAPHHTRSGMIETEDTKGVSKDLDVLTELRKPAARDLWPKCGESLRPSCVVSVLPVVGNAGISENEVYEIREACLCTHIIGENHNAALALLQANDSVCRLLVVATFEEAMPLRSIEDH